MITISDHTSFTPDNQRNYILSSHRKDGLIEWMKEMLNHSFVLNAKDTYQGTMLFCEELIEEHRKNRDKSRLKTLVPTVGKFHTPLQLANAFRLYDEKYSISKRTMIPPSVNEIRHILNLAQILAIGKNLSMISFDGDQTLYTDGGCFDHNNHELALALIRLLCHNVKVIIVTAAGYGYDAPKYEYRIQELLNLFILEQMDAQQIGNFYVLGGECHYLFQCRLVVTEQEIKSGEKQEKTDMPEMTEEEKYEKTHEREEGMYDARSSMIAGEEGGGEDLMTTTRTVSGDGKAIVEATVPPLSTTATGIADSQNTPAVMRKSSSNSSKKTTIITQRARLVAIPFTEWQADHLTGPKPYLWPSEEVDEILDIAEKTMSETVDELKLRANILRKPKAVGVYPGGYEMTLKYPVGHGSRKLKQEALDEIVLRVTDAIRKRHLIKPFSMPYCVFNGGKDAWIDIGNKSVGVAALQGYFQCKPDQSLHVGDQFLSIGNDFAARETSACIWIINPRETGKVLQHVLKYKGIAPIVIDEEMQKRTMKEGKAATLNVYSGEIEA